MPCKHLEAELPAADGARNGRLLSYFAPDQLERMADDMAPTLDDKQVQRFVSKLAEHGLAEHEIIILVERVVYDRSVNEIVEEYGFTGAWVVYKIYKQAMAKAEKMYLEERGQ